MAQRGIRIEVIAMALGHSDIKTTMRYARLRADAMKPAFEAVASQIGHKSPKEAPKSLKKLA